MTEYIEREVVLAELAKGTIITDDLYGMGIMTGVSHAQDIVRSITAANVVPVVRGKWIIGADGSYMCSECGKVFRYEIGDYCSNCGTRLEYEE